MRLLAALLLLALAFAPAAHADNYAGQATLCTDGAFVGRITGSAVKTAIAIQNESDATQNHAERAAFSYKVLHAPEAYAANICRGAVSDGTTNAQLDTRLAAIWDAYAKVDP